MTSKHFNSALIALALVACSSEPPKPAEPDHVQAPTAVVRSSAIASTRAIAGSVRATTVSPLSAKVMGNVLRVHVAEGDRVRRGQLLVEIDPREGRAQAGAATSAIAAAQANANLAETTYKRYAALRARNSVSQQELDTVKASADAARAELQRIRSMSASAETFLDYSFVRSPIDGIVTARSVDPGAQAAPGMPLLVVEDASSRRVEATVPEDLGVRAGDPVTIQWSSGTLQAKVSRVQPSIDATTRSSLVQIDLDGSPALRSGSFVRVLFPSGQRDALAVPEGAIVRRGALTGVYVVGNGNIARLRLITLGENGEVLSGLDAGERIVTDPSKVADGVVIGARSAS